MKIIMQTLSAGPKGVRLPGVEYNVPVDEGRALISGGYATSAKVARETAARAAPDENAAQPKPRRRRRSAAAAR